MCDSNKFYWVSVSLTPGGKLKLYVFPNHILSTGSNGKGNVSDFMTSRCETSLLYIYISAIIYVICTMSYVSAVVNYNDNNWHVVTVVITRTSIQ